jgi:hypothetical protein
LLARFYKTHRYDRFCLHSIYDLSKDKKAFHAFLHKYLFIDIKEDVLGVRNSLQIRRFIGRIVKKITKQLYLIIREKASAKNIYTYELSDSSSKAAKVLWGDNDIFFEDEELAVVEVLLFLMKTKESGLMNVIRDIEPLELDPGLSSEYFQFLLKKRTNYQSGIIEEIEARYEELDHPGKRQKMIEIVKDPGALFNIFDEAI